MVDYRRMGYMEEQYLGNATSSITSLHLLRDLWKSPRGTVLRIEALALVAIAVSFLLAAFGSCRRWSNSWIVQKGFLAANVLTVSLGTYSIGLMQSSQVKSEMYPIWAVSLFTLLPCVDPITTYYGFDYKSPLSKMVFQICLYFGYVLLMSISTTTSSHTVNIAIYLLSAITFIKGFHRSLAIVLQSTLRGMIGCLEDGVERFYLIPGRNGNEQEATDLIVDFSPSLNASTLAGRSTDGGVRMTNILRCSSSQEKDGLLSKSKETKGDDELCFDDVSLAFSLSHLLQRHFVGLSRNSSDSGGIFFQRDSLSNDYMRVWKLIEVELAFLYESFFSSNAFLHFYQAKAASLWTFTSFTGICFVGVTVAIPGTMTRRSTSPNPGAGNIIFVDTTTSDLVITLVILVSLALLQLVLLIRCWTSNWAKVAFACEYVKNQEEKIKIKQPIWWMRLKRLIIARINWFDNYLWQDKLGQYSIVEDCSKGKWKLFSLDDSDARRGGYGCRKCDSLFGMLGLHYIRQVFWELLGNRAKVGASVRLHADVKESIAEFLCQIKKDTTVEHCFGQLTKSGVFIYDVFSVPHVQWGPERFLEMHIATCYFELVEREQDNPGNPAIAYFTRTAGCSSKQKTDDVGGGGGGEKDRRVAIALSRYYAYLVVSAPELLPWPSEHTEAYKKVASEARSVLEGRARAKDKLEAMKSEAQYVEDDAFRSGAALGMEMDPGANNNWTALANFWVQAFVFIAPHGNVAAHMQHLSQGGELITHLWALLYHIGIREWNDSTLHGY